MATILNDLLSDPKTVLALVAIGISVWNLIAARINQREQNRRWDALNAGSIDVSGANLKTWRRMSRAEALKTNWGYVPTVFHSGEKDECRLVCRLCAYESADKDAPLVPAMNTTLTADEIKNELERVGRTSPPVVVYKDYSLLFELENTGKTASADCTACVYSLLPEGEREIFRSNAPIRIPPGRKATIRVNLSWAAAIPLTKTLNFRILTKFSDPHDKPHERQTVISWDTESDEWMFGDITDGSEHAQPKV